MRMSATFLLASIAMVSAAFGEAEESELPADLEKLVRAAIESGAVLSGLTFSETVLMQPKIEIDSLLPLD